MTAAPTGLRTEYLENPVGLSLDTPRLSWRSGDTRSAEVQSAWQVQAASSAQTLVRLPDLWDSGVVDGSDNIAINYAGLGVGARSCVHWRVRTFDSDGLPSDWSEIANFEFALGTEAWEAEWIAVPLHGTRLLGTTVPLLRRRFRVSSVARNARLYLAVLGACRVWINEVELDVSEVPSGYTDYNRRIRYRTLRVDGLVGEGANSLTVLLADGWYAGFADGDTREHFGSRPQLLARLEIETDEAERTLVTTDAQWEWRVSPLIRADMSRGASIDGRAFGHHRDYLRQKRQWLPVETLPSSDAILLPWAQEGVRPLGRRYLGSVQRRSALRPGERRWLVMFPETVIGRAQVSLQGSYGSHVRLRYAAATDSLGSPVFSDDAHDDYTLSGDGQGEVFVPPFVRHRFRAIELTGDLPADGVRQVESIPVRQLLQENIKLHAEHPLLEKFHAGCLKRSLDLLQEVPWSGFSVRSRVGDYTSLYPVLETLAMQFDLCAWLRNWLDEMLAEECSPAGLPESVPALRHGRRLTPGIGSAEIYQSPMIGDPERLSEMALYIAETLYVYYGDRQALERVFPYARRLLFTLEAVNPNLIRPIDTATWQLDSMEAAVIGTGLFYEATCRAARIAGWLQLESQAKSLYSLGERIRLAFRYRFVAPNGLLVTDSANAYVLALSQSLLAEEEVPAAFNRFTQMVLDAGFQSVVHPLLVDKMQCVLTQNGRPDLAYALMLQTAAPAWLAPLVDGKMQGESLVSLADAAPVGWIYNHVAGLQPRPAEGPAFRRVSIQPCVPVGSLFPEGSPLNALELAFDSIQGRYLIRWSLAQGVFNLHVEIPCGCSAQVILPDGSRHEALAGHSDYRLLTDAADSIPMLSETY